MNWPFEGHNANFPLSATALSPKTDRLLLAGVTEMDDLTK